MTRGKQSPSHPNPRGGPAQTAGSWGLGQVGGDVTGTMAVHVGAHSGHVNPKASPEISPTDGNQRAQWRLLFDGEGKF